MNQTINILSNYHQALLSGFFVTLELSVLAVLAGILFGFAFGYLAYIYGNSIGVILSCGSFLLSSIPFLITLFWLHYPLQELFDIVIDPFITSALALSIVSILSVAQIFRNTLNNFPNQYILAARACGLDRVQVLLKIQFPIILRQIIPQLLTLQVNILHLSLFASLISVQELFRVAQQINSVTHKPIEIYTALALFYIIISLPINLLAKYLSQKYTRNFSEN
jgi:His/Glu/Gln/Arg/opine family amino acid ABC transporter permease subunit